MKKKIENLKNLSVKINLVAVYAEKQKILPKPNVVITGFVMMSINTYYFPMRTTAVIETIGVSRYAAIIRPKNIRGNGKIAKYAKSHLK